MTLKNFLFLALGFLFHFQSYGILNSKKKSPPSETFAVFAGTGPEVAWLLRMMIPEDLKIEILTLSHRNHNDHTNEIRAQALAALLRSDFLCLFGVGHETHWLNVPLLNARNPRLLPQAGGFCDLSIPFKNNPSLDSKKKSHHVPSHYWLGPDHLLSSGQYLRDFLSLQYPMLGPRFQERYQNLKFTIANLFRHPDLALIRSKKWSILGSEFSTFFEDFNISATILETSNEGADPNPKLFLEWVHFIKDQKPTALLAPLNYSPSIIKKIQEATGIPVLFLPFSMDQSPYPNDYVGFQYYLVSLLVEHLQNL